MKKTMKKTILIGLLLFCSFLVWGQGYAESVQFVVPESIEKNVTGSITIHAEVNGVAYQMGDIFEFPDKAVFNIYYSGLKLNGNKKDNVEISVEYGNYDYWNEHFNPVDKERVILEEKQGNIYPFKFTIEESKEGSIGIKLKARNKKNGQESDLRNAINNSTVLFEVDYNLRKIKDKGERKIVEEEVDKAEIVEQFEAAQLSDVKNNQESNTESEDKNNVVELAVIEEEARKGAIENSEKTEEELWKE